jgi:hypothetical protein
MLLMAVTLATVIVRMRAGTDANWPFIYWIAMTLLCFRYPQETFNPRIILIGLAAGLLLRFEFLNRIVANLVNFVEVCVWAYILYMGFIIVTT